MVISDSEDSAIEANAFSATVVNDNGKRSQQVSLSALLAISSISLSTSSNSTTTRKAIWLFDSGASRHMTGNIDDFKSLHKQQGTITIARQQRLPIDGEGTVQLSCVLPDGSTRTTELTNVLYSKQLHSTRLFSWPYVRNKGHEIQAKGDNLFLVKPNGSHSL